MRSLSLLTLVLSACGASSQPGYTSNMVLQRAPQQAILAGNGSTAGVSVVINFNGQNGTATADAIGAWNYSLPATPAGGPYIIVVTSGSSRQQLNNVLFGDVIMCSGQSNMVYTLTQIFGNDTYSDASSFYPDIRVMNEVTNSWQVSSKASLYRFSAVCYSSALFTYNTSRVPSGLFQTSVGGTRIESWSPPGTQSNCHGYDIPDYASLYNARVAPFIPQRISAVIWYQGEANFNAAGIYNCQSANLVRSWRANFGYNDSLPWFVIQLAGWPANNIHGVSSLRQAQKNVADAVPNVSIFTATDSHDKLSPNGPIHPRNKAPIGSRISNGSLNKLYNKNLVSAGASFNKVESVKTATMNTTSVNITSTISFVADQTAQGLTIRQVNCSDPEVFGYCDNLFEVSVQVAGAAAVPTKWIAVQQYSSQNGMLVLSTVIPVNSSYTGWRYAWEDIPPMVLYNAANYPTLPYQSQAPSIYLSDGYYTMNNINYDYGIGYRDGPVVEGVQLSIVKQIYPVWLFQADSDHLGSLKHNSTGLYLATNNDCSMVFLEAKKSSPNQRWLMIYTGFEDSRYSIYSSVCGWKVLNSNCNYKLNITLDDDVSPGSCTAWSLTFIASAPLSTTNSRSTTVQGTTRSSSQSVQSVIPNVTQNVTQNAVQSDTQSILQGTVSSISDVNRGPLLSFSGVLLCALLLTSIVI